MSEREECCENCKFWLANIEGGFYGSCRRHPPTRLALVTSCESEEFSRFPDVVKDQWCGEWRVSDDTEE
jgi:hypothetical protein